MIPPWAFCELLKVHFFFFTKLDPIYCLLPPLTFTLPLLSAAVEWLNITEMQWRRGWLGGTHSHRFTGEYLYNSSHSEQIYCLAPVYKGCHGHVCTPWANSLCVGACKCWPWGCSGRWDVPTTPGTRCVRERQDLQHMEPEAAFRKFSLSSAMEKYNGGFISHWKKTFQNGS